MLAIADLLPVMTAFVDRELRYPLPQQALSPNGSEKPRKRDPRASRCATCRREEFAERRPLIEAALKGERKFFASRIRASRARHARAAGRLCAMGRARTGEVARDHRRPQGHDRAARRRAGAAGERGAVPADRQFGAGIDVGDADSTGSRDFVNEAYAEFALRAGRRPRGGAQARLARTDPPGRRRPDRRREHRRRGEPEDASRSRAATGAWTANIAG